MPGNKTKGAPYDRPAPGVGRVLLGLILLFALPRAGSGQGEGDRGVLKELGRAFSAVAEKTSRGVVAVRSTRRVTAASKSQEETPSDPSGDPFGEDFFQYFFRRHAPQDDSTKRDYIRRAQGSGFIISKEGHILTNNHVVAGADKISVELADGRTTDAEVVGTDAESDVAVIRIKADNLEPVPLGDSEALQVGEWVLAIGNPLGLSHSITAGIVSAKGRSGFNVATYENFIQTDAAINMGNSGGPLVNLKGQAVGINTFIVGPGGGNIGIGFAIPINIARDVAEQLIRTGAVERGYLGMIPQDLTPELAEALGVRATHGVIIAYVAAGSAAALAGLERGDVVVQFGGAATESAAHFRDLVAGRKPGAEVELVVIRDGVPKTITAVLEKRPPAEEPRHEPPGPTESQDELERLGLTVEEMTPELAARFGLKNRTGIVIMKVTPGSEAAEKGLRQGYVVQEVNRRAVDTVAQFKEAVSRALAERRRILLFVTNEQSGAYVLLNPARQ
jgi:serine protease Do